MNPIFRLIEILFLVVFPILILFLRSSWNHKEIYLNVTILPLLWYLSHAPLHEIGHIFGCFLVGAEITEYRLFSHFWEGSFGYAFVNIKNGFDENLGSFVILMFPYLLDLISILIGFLVMTKTRIKNSFLCGITFLLLIVRPIYDLTSNYIGFFLDHSDFVLASRIIGIQFVSGFVIFAIGTGIFITLRIFKLYDKFPNPANNY